MNLEKIIKNKFKNYSNKKLISTINYRYKNNLNDDDQIYELCRRRKIQRKQIAIVDGEKFVSVNY